MAFVDLKKAFNRVPRKVLCWALCVVEYQNGQLKQCKPCMYVPEVEHK